MVANYGAYTGNTRMAAPMTNTPQVSQPQQVAPTPNYSDWIAQNAMTQPTPPATEQRGITTVYMVHSRAEYSTIYPPAGQTIAIFNFPDNEVCLKAKDVWGIDLGIRTFELRETTPSIPAPTNGVQNQNTPEHQEPTVSKAEFDALTEKFNALYKELKG